MVEGVIQTCIWRLCAAETSQELHGVLQRFEAAVNALKLEVK